MNIFKTSDGVLRTALCFSTQRSLLGSLFQRERTLIKKTELRQASSWCWISTGRPAVSRVRYYSQDDHLRAPIQQSLELQNPSKLQSLSEPQRPSKSEKNLFFQQLDECSSPSDVLDLIDDSMQTHRRISYCLSRIWETTKKMSDDQRRYELKLMFEHQGFEELCQGVISLAPKMQTKDMAYSLLAVVRLGVPQHSRVVQTLLRVIQVAHLSIVSMLALSLKPL